MNLAKIKKKHTISKPKVRIRSKMVKPDVVVSTEIEKKPLKVNSKPLEIEIKEEVQKPEVAVEIEIKAPPEKKDKKRIKFSLTATKLLDEETKKALDIIKDIEDESTISTVLFGEGRNASGNYSIRDKVRAIMLMRASSREKAGKLEPNFSRVSRWLNVRHQTLSTWWSNREDIIGTSGGVAAEVERVALFEASLLLLEVMDRLRELVEEKKLSGKEYVSLFNVVVNKMMMLKGTVPKKRVDHYVHNLPVKTVAPESAGK